MEVHKELGSGFLEAVYEEALSIEFCAKKILFESQKVLDVNYKGTILKKKYKADFVCYNEIIVEIKACETLNSQHQSQVLNYLKATGKHL